MGLHNPVMRPAPWWGSEPFSIASFWTRTRGKKNTRVEIEPPEAKQEFGRCSGAWAEERKYLGDGSVFIAVASISLFFLTNHFPSLFRQYFCKSRRLLHKPAGRSILVVRALLGILEHPLFSLHLIPLLPHSLAPCCRFFLCDASSCIMWKIWALSSVVCTQMIPGCDRKALLKLLLVQMC